MSIILTNPTDQYEVKYGYCSKCGGYNEVWRKEKTSKCSCCGKKMIHISAWKMWLLILILFIILQWKFI